MASFNLFGIQTAIGVSRRDLIVYVNSFSGDATVELPSTLQMARGGVCVLSCYMAFLLQIIYKKAWLFKSLNFECLEDFGRCYGAW